MKKPTKQKLVEDPATGCAVAAHWVKAIVTYRNIYHLQMGLPLCMKLMKDGVVSGIYYSRYTSAPFRLEIQMWTDASNKTLFKHIMDYRFQNMKPLGVRFEDCNGSHPHALAFNIVMMLTLQGKLSMQMLQDIHHWTYNMAGFSYVQEAASALTESYVALRNIPGWSDQPVFSTKLVKRDEPSKPRKHLRRAKA